MKRLITVFCFWVYLIVVFKINFITSEDPAPIQHNFIHPKNFKSITKGLIGYKCDFTGVHSFEPSLQEHRSVVCNVSTYFIYDTIKLVIPSKQKNPIFKLKPESCFTNVYTNLINETTVELKNLDPQSVIEEPQDTEDTKTLSIILTPFNKNNVEFFCVCDNSDEKSGSTLGRMAFVNIRMLKYPYKIHAINLRNEALPHLPQAIVKDAFVNNTYTLDLNYGELLMLNCDLIDDKCFKKSENKELYKSSKIITRDTTVIFKAPFYVSKYEVNATCTCKIDNTEYKIIIQPNKSKKRTIVGCDFTKKTTESMFSLQLDINDIKENTTEECIIDLEQGKHDSLVGLNCPGVIDPNCFFQVYEHDKKDSSQEYSKITYLDNQLGISGLEFYDEVENGNTKKIFSLVGNLKNGKSFSCICKYKTKTAVMIVQLAASYKFTLSIVLIITIAIVAIIV